ERIGLHAALDPAGGVARLEVVAASVDLRVVLLVRLEELEHPAVAATEVYDVRGRRTVRRGELDDQIEGQLHPASGRALFQVRSALAMFVVGEGGDRALPRWEPAPFHVSSAPSGGDSLKALTALDAPMVRNRRVAFGMGENLPAGGLDHGPVAVHVPCPRVV